MYPNRTIIVAWPKGYSWSQEYLLSMSVDLALLLLREADLLVLEGLLGSLGVLTPASLPSLLYVL